MDPVSEAFYELVGEDVLRQVLRQQGQAVEIATNQVVREGTEARQVNVNQMQGPPCDIVDALFEERLFDLLVD